MTDMSAIVGAGFPRPMGWETQPLRIPFSRLGPLRPCVFALNIPPIFNPANPLIPSEHPDSDNPHIALRWSAVLGPIALL